MKKKFNHWINLGLGFVVAALLVYIGYDFSFLSVFLGFKEPDKKPETGVKIEGRRVWL